MLRSSLTDPDDPQHRADPHHNPVVSAALNTAIGLLKRASLLPDAYRDGYRQARDAVARCVGLSMSLHQRMLVWYVVAWAYTGARMYEAALVAFELALDAAEDDGDQPAIVELAQLAASAARARSLYARAAHYLNLSLATLRALGADRAAVDGPLELRLLLELAICDYTLDEYETAAQRLTAARLIMGTGGDPTRRATLDWEEALVWRWRDAPERALPYALSAVEAYAQEQTNAAAFALGRLQAVVADIAFDAAELYPAAHPHYARDGYLRLAEPYALRATVWARETGDVTGEGIAQLARARFDRLAGRQASTAPAIEDVLRLAEREDDAPLRIQARTALGQDLAANGERERALNSYRAALTLAEASESPAAGHWAKRELIAAAMHPDR